MVHTMITTMYFVSMISTHLGKSQWKVPGSLEWLRNMIYTCSTILQLLQSFSLKCLREVFTCACHVTVQWLIVVSWMCKQELGLADSELTILGLI